jgi:chloride channel 3/4/5
MSFLCSGVAAASLRQLNPTGTGKLVLFETNYGTNYDAIHYLAFVFLGVAGGLFGGVFCQANFAWSRHFRQFTIIKNYPVFELSLVVLVTAVLQFPNPMIRETGDIALAELLVDCRDSDTQSTWICQKEASPDKSMYLLWLVEGTLVKLVLTIITFGCKVPSGVIIPALNAGALFGRLLGQVMPGISPGIFAMVGSAAFLAGVSRMTVSLAVIMFELTGEVYYILPMMTAILTAKWVADSISTESVYELSQHILGHPFLDLEHALRLVRAGAGTVEDLIPPKQTMNEITLSTGPRHTIETTLLRHKLQQLKARGLMDAGLVLVNDSGVCQGYLPQAELEFALSLLDEGHQSIDLRGSPLSDLIDRTPLSVPAKAPIEVAVDMFGRLGLRYLIIVEEGTARVVGVIIKKRLVSYIDRLR